MLLHFYNILKYMNNNLILYLINNFVKYMKYQWMPQVKFYKGKDLPIENQSSNVAFINEP